MNQLDPTIRRIIISFGDGTSTTQSAVRPLAIGHVYSRTGIFTMRVTATDEFGHTSTAATITDLVPSKGRIL